MPFFNWFYTKKAQYEKIIELTDELQEVKTLLESVTKEREYWCDQTRNYQDKTEEKIHQIDKLNMSIQRAESERDEFKKQLKSQLKSELVLISLKIIIESLQPKPKKEYISSLAVQQAAMQSQLSAFGQATQLQYPYYGLGLANLLGEQK